MRATGVKNTESKKKRTFGKSKSPAEVKAAEAAESKETQEEALKTLKSRQSRQSLARASMSRPKVVVEVVEVEEEVVVLPEETIPEALPEVVYPKARESPEAAAAAAANAKASLPVNLANGDGFSFRGRWTYDYLALSPLTITPGSALDPCPATLAWRSDLGARELVRCY